MDNTNNQSKSQSSSANQSSGVSQSRGVSQESVGQSMSSSRNQSASVDFKRGGGNVSESYSSGGQMASGVGNSAGGVAVDYVSRDDLRASSGVSRSTSHSASDFNTAMAKSDGAVAETRMASASGLLFEVSDAQMGESVSFSRGISGREEASGANQSSSYINQAVGQGYSAQRGFTESVSYSDSVSSGTNQSSPYINQAITEKGANGYKSASVNDLPDGTKKIQLTFEDRVGSEYAGEVGKPSILLKETFERQDMSITLSPDGTVKSELTQANIERSYGDNGKVNEVSSATSSTDLGQVGPEKLNSFKELADKVAHASNVAEAAKSFDTLLVAVAERDIRSNTAQAESQWQSITSQSENSAGHRPSGAEKASNSISADLER